MNKQLDKFKNFVKNGTRTFTKNKKSEEDQNDIDRYKRRLIRRRKRLLKRIGVVAVLLVFLGIAVNLVLEKRVYHNYEVQAFLENEDTISNNYSELDGNVLKYGSEGASLISTETNVLWSEAYAMQDPASDICNETAVVYNYKGSSMYIFSQKGLIGKVETSMPILKARVATQGVVAAILEDGEKTWINFYATDGSIIAENQTRVDSPGYPMDIAVSPNGELLMVAYVYVEGGTTTSYVAFYNFGDAGKNEIDNIVSGYTFEGVLAPQVAYLDGSTSLAYREDGFTIFEGNEIPEETETITVEEEVISTFYDDSHVGMVFKNEDESKQYRMQVYNVSGKLLFEKDFNIEYENIKISNDMIIMHNNSQVCLISLKGVEKFNGTVDEGSIRNIFKTGGNQYMLVTDKGISTIKFR